MKLEKEYANSNLEETYNLLNNLIHDNKIVFNYYNNAQNIEPIKVCYNRKDARIEIAFRNNMQEYINELRTLNEKYERNHK